jgi:hypothetical protein
MSGGGGGAPTSTTTTTQNFSPEEAAQRALVQQEANRVYQTTKGTIGASPYPGASPTPFSPETLQAQTSLMNWAGGAGGQLANQAGAYSNFLMGPAQYAESNPYLQSAIGAAIRPVTQAYTDPGGVMSQIRGNAIQAGGYGTSTRQGIAEGIAGRGYLNTIGDITSKMANENYQGARNAGTAALAAAPGTFTLGTEPAKAFGAVGSQRETLSQAEEQRRAEERLWNLNSQWTPLQNYANIVFGGGSPGTTSTAQGYQPQSNSLLQTVGTLATIASLFSGFSDRRLKRNIKKIGTTVLNLPLYVFDYVWGGRFIGVMADEVEKVLPEAVSELYGFKVVNYGALYNV